MRIGLLTTSFPRHLDDIAGAFVLGFARALAALGHEIEVLAPEPARGQRAPVYGKVSVRWVPYMRPRRFSRTFYGAGVPDNLQQSILAWLGLLPFTVQLTRSAGESGRGWNALVSHWALPCALAAGASRGTRPHLAVLHSADVHLLSRLPARGLLSTHIAGGASAMLFVSSDHREKFVSWLPARDREAVAARCRVLPMGFDPVGAPSASRQQLRRSLGLDRFTLLSMGRLVPVKGYHDAIASLSGRRDVELLIAGDGPLRRSLARFAEQRRAPVRFLGRVAGQRKRDLLRCADAYVSCSRVLASGRTEGMPTALLEALGHGLPVIATDVGGVADYLQQERTAVLVPPCRPDALGSAVDRLKHDAALRSRLAASGQTFAERFTWPCLAPQIEQMLVAPDC
jgi:glycosyltransferase involved in cell wall biosynthesis